MYKRIVAIKGFLDTIDFFTDCLVDSFRALGFEVYVYNINSGTEANKYLADFLKFPIDFAIGYNNAGFIVRNGECCLWDALDICYINIIVDAPVHYTNTIDNFAYSKSLFLCVDREHPYYIDRMWPQIPTAFLPHAAWSYEPVSPSNERHTDIIYAGSLSVTSIEHFPDIGKGEFNTNDLVYDVYDELIRNPNQTSEYVIEQWLISHNLHYDNTRLKDIFHKLVHITGLVTSHFRQKQIETLTNNGFRINVYGSNWDNCPCFKNPNFIFQGKISPTRIFDKMSDSKIILNSMPWFKNGSHERIFNGMLAGGVVVTDYSSYLEDTFIHGEDILIYDLLDMDKLPDYAEKIIFDRDYAHYIACNAQKKILENHMFINRAIEIIDYYQCFTR